MPIWTAMDDLATGDVVAEADMDALRGNIEYLLAPDNVIALRNNAGLYSTTSVTFVAVDGTNVSVSLTTKGGHVLVSVAGYMYHSTTGYVYVDIAVDGTRVGAAFANGLSAVNGGTGGPLALSVLVTGLAAGAHTFQLQWKTNTGTAYLDANAAAVGLQLFAVEI